MSGKKPLPPTYFYAAILLMLVLHFVVPLADLIPMPWKLLGLVPLVVGVIINVLADNAFKRHQTTVKPFERSDALVTDGIFRYTRNPMYLGMALGLLGITVLLESLSPVAVIPVFMALVSRTFIRAEESMLAETFGAAFDEYRRTTRRWL